MVTMSLGATGSTSGGPGHSEYDMGNDGIPIAGRTVINTFYTQRDGKTNPDVFIGNVGYYK